MLLLENEKATDLRVRRTLVNLQQALVQLMSEKTFQSITVQEITDRAMVNRATFYDHFTDKYALLEYAIRSWFYETLSGQLREDSRFSVENLQRLIQIVCEFLTLVNTHCGPNMRGDKQLLPIFETQVTTLLHEQMTRWLKEAWEGEKGKHPPYALAASVTSWAIYGAALHWSKTSSSQSLDKFVAQVTPMILAGLERTA